MTVDQSDSCLSDTYLRIVSWDQFGVTMFVVKSLSPLPQPSLFTKFTPSSSYFARSVFNFSSNVEIE